MNMRFGLTLLLCVGAAVTTSCTTYRAVASKTPDDLADLSSCSSKKELAKKLGGPDRAMAIPGGGYIEIYDVLLRNPETTSGPLTSAFLSIGSFGIVDMTAGLIDAAFECGDDSSNSSGMGAKCDYRKMRFYVHYADAASQQMACFEEQELRVGSTFYTSGDNSFCPLEYKEALATVIDTAEFPTVYNSVVIGPQFSSASVYEKLRMMTAMAERHCGKASN